MVAVYDSGMLAGNVFDKSLQVAKFQQRRGFTMRHVAMPRGFADFAFGQEQRFPVKTQFHHGDRCIGGQLGIQTASGTIPFDLVGAPPSRTAAFVRRVSFPG